MDDDIAEWRFLNLDLRFSEKELILKKKLFGYKKSKDFQLQLDFEGNTQLLLSQRISELSFDSPMIEIK